MGSATTASTKNFQRQPENAIHQAIGRPSISNMADTVIASCRVSPNACQSIAIRNVLSPGNPSDREFQCSAAVPAAAWGAPQLPPDPERISGLDSLPGLERAQRRLQRICKK